MAVWLGPGELRACRWKGRCGSGGHRRAGCGWLGGWSAGGRGWGEELSSVAIPGPPLEEAFTGPGWRTHCAARPFVAEPSLLLPSPCSVASVLCFRHLMKKP